jgi:hypothetical protein
VADESYDTNFRRPVADESYGFHDYFDRLARVSPKPMKKQTFIGFGLTTEVSVIPVVLTGKEIKHVT